MNITKFLGHILAYKNPLVWFIVVLIAHVKGIVSRYKG